MPAGFLIKYNKWQCRAISYGINVFPIDCAGFRCDYSAGKDNIRHQIRNIARQLLYSMQHISVHKYAVTCFQYDVLLSNLEVQNPAYCGGNFKIRMPVQGPCVVWKSGKFIPKKSDGKYCGIVGYLFSQLMIKYYRHFLLLQGEWIRFVFVFVPLFSLCGTGVSSIHAEAYIRQARHVVGGHLKLICNADPLRKFFLRDMVAVA